MNLFNAAQKFELIAQVCFVSPAPSPVTHMIEVDVFWAWAIGGSLAYASTMSLAAAFADVEPQVTLIYGVSRSHTSITTSSATFCISVSCLRRLVPTFCGSTRTGRRCSSLMSTPELELALRLFTVAKIHARRAPDAVFSHQRFEWYT